MCCGGHECLFGSISEHILFYCPAYNTARQNAIKLGLQVKNQHVHKLVTHFLLTGPHKLLQFLLDCSTIPEVISMAQQHGNNIFNDLLYLGRTWCFAIHRMRMKRLCKWNFRWTSPFWYLGHWDYLVKTTPIYQKSLSPEILYQYSVNLDLKSLFWLFMDNKRSEWGLSKVKIINEK